MTDEMRAQALDVATAIARDFAADGAQAVYLTGSWARGDAHPESDLDLRVVGPSRDKELMRGSGFLVSHEWMETGDHRSAFDDISKAGSVVPGWRSAMILHDPHGIAADLKREAKAWTWERVEKQREGFVASQITKHAEGIHSLVGNLDQGIPLSAAVERSTIAAGLAPILAVHLSLLYETEKELWDLVADEMGPEWKTRQEHALAIDGGPFERSCIATFDLFRRAADEMDGALEGRRREVVRHAYGLATAAIEKLEKRETDD